MRPISRLLGASVCASGIRVGTAAQTCTRAVYHGLDDRSLTGRTFDFEDPIIIRAKIPWSPTVTTGCRESLVG